MSLQSQYTRADSPDEKLAKMQKMLSLLEQRPHTTIELANAIKNSRTLAGRYLDEMAAAEVIERMASNSYYWQKKGHTYAYDLENAVITSIPAMMFTEIPLIKPWYNYAKGNTKREQYISTFKAICYGEVAEKFTINPSKWQHPVTTDQFYQAYKEQYGREYQEHIQKALRAFLMYCLKVPLIAGDRRQAFFGLLSSEAPAKYGHIKLTKKELDAAISWLESDQAAQTAKQNGITHDYLKGHFAYALEGFPRPSRCLTIEVDRIMRYRDVDNNLILHWTQPETKQNSTFPKFMQDQRLVKWAIGWLDKRRELNYRYLFVDDNNYQIEQGDSQKLAPIRSMPASCYKEMFKALGKDGYFLQDTLYSLRHCGVHLWLERTGYNYDWIVQMGWDNANTLRKYYGVMGSGAMLQFILQGNKKA